MRLCIHVEDIVFSHDSNRQPPKYKTVVYIQHKINCSSGSSSSSSSSSSNNNNNTTTTTTTTTNNNNNNNNNIEPAMAQSFGRPPLIAEDWVQSQARHCGFPGGKIGSATGFILSTSVFPGH